MNECTICQGLGFTARHEIRENGTPFHRIAVVMEECPCGSRTQEEIRDGMEMVRAHLSREIAIQAQLRAEIMIAQALRGTGTGEPVGVLR